MMSRFWIFAGAIVSILMISALPHSSVAAEPEKLGSFKDWTAYVYQEKTGKACFMMSKPSKSEGKYAKRGDVYVQITHRTGDNTRDVVSFTAGYPFKAGSDLKVIVDKQTFTFFTQGEMAWAAEEALDRQVSQALRKGKSMTVKGVSSRGTDTIDTYSLKGSSAAYEAISKACPAS